MPRTSSSSSSSGQTMTVSCGRRSMAFRYSRSSGYGSSIATTLGRSRRRARRSSIANSMRPGRTGKYRMSPRVRLAGSDAAGITASLIAERLLNRELECVLVTDGAFLAELHREPRDVDAVAYRVALVGRMGLLEEIDDV